MISKDSIIQCGTCRSVNYAIIITKRGYNEYTCKNCGQKIPTYLIPDFGLTPIQLEKRQSNLKSNPKRDFNKYKRNKIKARTEAALKQIVEMGIKMGETKKRRTNFSSKGQKIDLTKVCVFKDDEVACIKNCPQCKWRVTKNTYDILSVNCPFNNTEDCIHNCSGCHWQLKQNVPYEYKPLEIYP